MRAKAVLGLIVIAGCEPAAQGTASAQAPPAAVVAGDEPGAGAVAVATFAVGDRVSCNWKSGGTYYDGRIAELRQGGRIIVHYDDGDVEETTPELCRALAAQNQPEPDGGGLSGSYTIVSSANPGGGAAYSGNVRIAKRGDVYQLSWSIPGSPPYSGVGLEVGGTLAVGWGMGSSPGVVVYQVAGGQLQGKWATFGSSQVGSENLSGPAGLSGRFQITSATNPRGASYTGTVAIAKSGDTYSLLWTLPNETYTGVGILRQDVLAVGWGDGIGVVVYEIRGNRLEGVWADARGGALGKELLERH